jgi:CRP/FNR family transcriptional regulator, dissimilatory nitrate respiration regulator
MDVMDAFGLDDAPKSLRQKIQHRSLATGAALFRQGDAVTAVYVVEKGRIAMIRHTSDGRRITLFTACAGDSFAEAALFSDIYHCDAVAEAATSVAVIPKRELLAALARHQHLSQQLMAHLAHQVQNLRQRLELRNIRNARERVWQALVLAAGAKDRTVEFDRPLRAVASDIGLTHEAFYRALSALARTGRIRRRGRRIEIVARI